MKTIRIGCGAGYGGDRYEPAIDLVNYGNINYLIYECMAERTIALYQKDKLKDNNLGYNPQLVSRLSPVLKKCSDKHIKIITNMGAANPSSAVDIVYSLAESMGLHGLKIACVLGDDILDKITMYGKNKIMETDTIVSNYYNSIVSANVYLGIDGIVEALNKDADVIVTGRVADPSLFLAPMVYEFGWSSDNYKVLGKGTILAHLMECAGQVTGGYFADPGYKDVPELWNLGFPIVEVFENGDGVITKVENTGGIVNVNTCKEQLLYEIHDPSAYITPDCVANFTAVKLEQIGKDMVEVTGGKGKEKTDTLKVSIGYKDSYIGIGEISYAGPGAVERANLAKQIVEKRLNIREVKFSEIRYDLIGINSLHGDGISDNKGNPYEVRLRIAARCEEEAEAKKIGEEVETLWTNGPYGGGGATKEVKEIVGIVSTLIPRNDINQSVKIKELV